LQQFYLSSLVDKSMFLLHHCISWYSSAYSHYNVIHSKFESVTSLRSRENSLNFSKKHHWNIINRARSTEILWIFTESHKDSHWFKFRVHVSCGIRLGEVIKLVGLCDLRLNREWKLSFRLLWAKKKFASNCEVICDLTGVMYHFCYTRRMVFLIKEI